MSLHVAQGVFNQVYDFVTH